MKTTKFILLITTILIFGCSELNNSNRLDSDNYKTKKERIEILKKAIISASEFENAEFELFNVNGFSNSRTMVPGASSWDYKFSIKVNPIDLDKWTDGMIKVDLEDYDGDWTKEIIEKRKENWKTESQPEYYTRKGGNITLILFRNEGIIFKRVINN